MPDRILIVEDDDDCLESLVDAVSDAGYQVTTARTGLKAIEWLDALPAASAAFGGARPKVILLDLMLPELDGWGVVRELARRPLVAEIPVLLISGEKDLSRHARDLGVAAYLRKPVKLAELWSTIERLVTAPPPKPDAPSSPIT